MPLLLTAQNMHESPTPWSLNSNLLNELIGDPSENSDKRISAFLESLKTLSEQVPEENRGLVSSPKSSSQNIKQLLHLRFGKEKIKFAVKNAARRVEATLINHKTLPDPCVWLVGFGDSTLNFELVVWVDFRRIKKKLTSLQAAYYWEIETALTENGLEISFPQRNIHIK